MENNEEKIKKEKVNEKKDGRTNVIIILLAICVASLIGIIVWLLFFHKTNSNSYSNSKDVNIPKVELNYSTNKIESSGIYITDVSAIVDDVMPSIVSITSKTIINSGRFGPSFYGSGQYTAVGAGSGVIVAENDNEIFVLTNYHVVDDTDELSVKFIDDNSYDASIKGFSKENDVAIVSILKSNLSDETLSSIKVAVLGNSDDLKVGNGIIAIGNALGYGQSVTTGVVSALNRKIANDDTSQNMIQIDAAINGGNSGGALLNSNGEVIGINRAKYSNNYSSSASIEGMGFAIPISDVKSVIEDLINGKSSNDGVILGVEGYMTNEGGIASYGLPIGFYISKINSGSNADKSDLEIGNIITEVDNNTVTSLDDIKKVLKEKKSGDNVILKVKYINKNEYMEKEVVVTLN